MICFSVIFVILLIIHKTKSCGNVITNLDATETINSSTPVDTQIFQVDASGGAGFPLVMTSSSDFFELQGDDDRMVQVTDCLVARSTHYLTIQSQYVSPGCPGNTGTLTVEVDGSVPQFDLTHSSMTVVVTSSDLTAGSINLQEFSISNEGKCTEFQCDVTCTNSDQIFSTTTDSRTSIVICEGVTETLSCTHQPGTVIDITYAVYGRTSDQVCIHASMHDLNCRKENGTDLPLVIAACDGLTSCNLKADNQVFEDPCKGTFKYLDIIYDCKPGALQITASVSEITYDFVYNVDVKCYDRNAKGATSVTKSFDVLFIDYLSSTTTQSTTTTTPSTTTTTTTPTTTPTKTTTTTTTTTPTTTTTTTTPTSTTTASPSTSISPSNSSTMASPTTAGGSAENVTEILTLVEVHSFDLTILIVAALSSVGGASLIGIIGMLIYRATNICRIPKGGSRRSDHDDEEEEETHGEEDDHSSYRSYISNTGNESPLSVNSRISLIGTPVPGARITPVEIDDWYNLHEVPMQEDGEVTRGNSHWNDF